MTTTVPPALAELTEILAYADVATGASASVREALGLGSQGLSQTDKRPDARVLRASDGPADHRARCADRPGW